MRNVLPFSLVLILLVSLVACGGRRPGPRNFERGRVTQWRVEDSSIAYDGCTDSTSWRPSIELELAPVGWYVAYMVSEDGTEAIDYDCDTTDTTSCYPNPADFAWQVDGHTLTFDMLPQAFALTGTTCEIQLHRIWTVQDEGTTGVVQDQMAVSLIGDATECGVVDDQIRSDSANGLGLQGCTVTMSANMSFFNSATP